jgi:hypothetical protein
MHGDVLRIALNELRGSWRFLFQLTTFVIPYALRHEVTLRRTVALRFMLRRARDDKGWGQGRAAPKGQ